MNISKKFTCILATVLLGVLSGCSKPDKSGTTNADGTTSGYITIKGSDTMVHLVSTWAEEYMNANANQEVSVTGGGSGTGIAALINGTADIAMASRDMKEKEHDLAATGGITAEEIVVARDGIAMIVNPNNPVSELTIQQLGDMYTGKITNWSGVGGPDHPITLLSRESSSGTYVFVQERVLGKQDYAATARLMPATSGVVQAVSTDQWSIGYVGLGYAHEAGDSVKSLSVKNDDTSPAVAPSVATVQSGDYAIARPLHLYATQGDNASVQAFVDFCLSAEGQKIVADSGYVPVN